jgi:hypothetical protein
MLASSRGIRLGWRRSVRLSYELAGVIFQESNVKEYPILFNTEMVRAILDGRKRQTRRIPRYQIDYHADEHGPPEGWYSRNKRQLWNGPYAIEDFIARWCPYGQPGDLLWVREAWALRSGVEPAKASSLIAPPTIWYRADGTVVNHPVEALPTIGKWRPSIHMPRWASRLTLRVTDVRVERVQDISYNDCIEEGVHEDGAGWHFEMPAPTLGYAGPDRAFAELWDSINAKRGFGWETNCWVWAISFEIDATIIT